MPMAADESIVTPTWLAESPGPTSTTLERERGLGVKEMGGVVKASSSGSLILSRTLYKLLRADSASKLEFAVHTD